jgi:hypothetical protein
MHPSEKRLKNGQAVTAGVASHVKLHFLRMHMPMAPLEDVRRSLKGAFCGRLHTSRMGEPVAPKKCRLLYRSTDVSAKTVTPARKAAVNYDMSYAHFKVGVRV